MNNSKAHHAPLHLEDTLEMTVGCRHTNPDNCSKAEMPKVCALVRDDGMCISPPKSWSKQYAKLKEAEEGSD